MTHPVPVARRLSVARCWTDDPRPDLPDSWLWGPLLSNRRKPIGMRHEIDRPRRRVFGFAQLPPRQAKPTVDFLEDNAAATQAVQRAEQAVPRPAIAPIGGRQSEWSRTRAPERNVTRARRWRPFCPGGLAKIRRRGVI